MTQKEVNNTGEPAVISEDVLPDLIFEKAYELACKVCKFESNPDENKRSDVAKRIAEKTVELYKILKTANM